MKVLYGTVRRLMNTYKADGLTRALTRQLWIAYVLNFSLGFVGFPRFFLNSLSVWVPHNSSKPSGCIDRPRIRCPRLVAWWLGAGFTSGFSIWFGHVACKTIGFSTISASSRVVVIQTPDSLPVADGLVAGGWFYSKTNAVFNWLSEHIVKPMLFWTF